MRRREENEAGLYVTSAILVKTKVSRYRRRSSSQSGASGSGLSVGWVKYLVLELTL